MSEPVKTFFPCKTKMGKKDTDWVVDMMECPGGAGDYVLYSDYAALVQQGIRDHQDWRSKLNFLETDYKAEVARLTAENARLKAEVEWLRKADRLVCWNANTQTWETRFEAPK